MLIFDDSVIHQYYFPPPLRSAFISWFMRLFNPDVFYLSLDEILRTFEEFFWCRIHLWFRLMGGLQAKSMSSQRYRAEPSQDGGYALLWQRYDKNKMVAMRYYGNVILHLQQYSHRLNLLYFFYLHASVLAFLTASSIAHPRDQFEFHMLWRATYFVFLERR